MSAGQAGYLQKTLKALQAQRDAGILSAEEYRRAAAAVVNAPDPESGAFADPGPGRTPIPGMHSSLTGQMGVEVGRDEFWLNRLVRQVAGKHVLMAVVFCLMVAYFVAEHLVEAQTGRDPGAGAAITVKNEPKD
mmetsp:Transcript_13267/g.41984  ORF Transcript_13267/g.41984 Transcript_13267/m.41984 type:complete len:134 (-) Transcript_13267:173-574(-)|eukprot:CAMPEP_0182865254 /NCGR_PEP_ID=MMETSP0034_2-20130328/7597_1 /TAXON_ID=156128 /ORGANISM="Nephroselmis pyriformis, Strain CCMP717" /LENGTH=133 /DNA_ID=CAMNT_0024997547 /DNA_START=133 /DNA_END=534 /DNA_ORIENTATION=+